MAQSRHEVTIDGISENVPGDEMDIEIVTDRFGKTMRFQMFEGRPYIPLYHPAILAQIKDVEFKPDDIFLSAFPRTGTHWTFEMTSMLLKGAAETVEASKLKHQLEFMDDSKLKLIPSPRLINGHMRLSDAPRNLKEVKCKIIYNLRDPKDVAISMYQAYLDLKVSECQCSFEGYLGLFLEGKAETGTIFDHWRDAEKFFDENPDIPVHFQIYEETLKDPVLQVQKLSDFLGLPRNDELCRAISEKCHFKKMLVDKDAYSIKVDGRNSLYRKGVVGDWSNWFSDEMLEEYYRVYEETMAGSRFYERYARNE